MCADSETPTKVAEAMQESREDTTAPPPPPAQKPAGTARVAQPVNLAESIASDPTIVELREFLTEQKRDKGAAACKALLESKNREPEQRRIDALMAVPESARASLVESWPERAKVSPRPSFSPPLLESRGANGSEAAGAAYKDPKKLVAACLSRN
jgi:hypothetical protein